MESQEKSSKVVGIDLGTTNSVVAIIDGGKPKVIRNQEGVRLTPSVLAFTANEGLKVGNIAKRQAVLNPENTFFSVKRFIGKTNVTTEELDVYPYKVTYDEEYGIRVYSPGCSDMFSPQQISGWILRKLVQDAIVYFDEKHKVTQAVITVPAYFNDSQRQATIDAGKIAGIEVLRIINEPTAASLAYGLTQKTNSKVLIFDLGGGTFDVSIMEVGEGISEVLATSGNTNLGGDDFTKVIVNLLVSEFEEKEGINLRDKDKVQALQRIFEAAEKAKIQLSSVESTTIYLPFILADTNNPKNIARTLTREEFISLSESLITECETPIKTALNDANLNTEDIDDILLVGGSTRIPAIQNLIRSLLKKEPSKSVDPDEVVALGAAIQAGILTGEVKDILLLDVTPLSLGIETLGNVLTKIITRNTAIPVRKSETFSTAYENQTDAEIHILQGESNMAKDNKSLGRFYLDGIPESQKGVPEIDITFDLNVDGILSVKAKERETGSEQSIQIQGTSALEQEEIERLLKAAEDYKYKETNPEDIESIEKIWNEIRQEIIRFSQKGYQFSNLSLVRIRNEKESTLPISVVNSHIEDACQRFNNYYFAKKDAYASMVIEWPKNKLR